MPAQATRWIFTSAAGPPQLVCIRPHKLILMMRRPIVRPDKRLLRNHLQHDQLVRGDARGSYRWIASIDGADGVVGADLLRMQASLDPELNRISKERYCKRCAPRHRVCMHSMLAKGGWYVTVVGPDLKASLYRRFVFQNDVKILDLARRRGASLIFPDVRRSRKGLPRAGGRSGSV